METVERMAAPPLAANRSYLEWGPVFAGAVTAAAVAVVLHGFAGAIGLAVSSTAPTWRDSSIALTILSGLYLILVAVASYGVGGYIAGRLRTPLAGVHADESEFRDGVHGLASWALATLLTAFLALSAASALTQLASPGGDAGPTASVGGENLIAYDLDQLLRSPRERPADYEYARAEAARILLTASGHSGVSEADRTYLETLVDRQTGVSGADAQGRVLTAIGSVEANIRAARQNSVILAFSIAAAALIGAAVAWFAAVLAAGHRDNAISPMWGWGGPRPRQVAPVADKVGSAGIA